MIRIKKGQAPAILKTGRGAVETQKLKDAFTADPAAYRSGEKTFGKGESVRIKSDIYGAKSVKNKLIDAQAGKCAFCESQIRHIDYGDVEHFRPKKGWRQTETDSLQRPGYYWLSYDWDNLLLSCKICNQPNKGNLFPLANPADRARSHTAGEDEAEEDPLLVQPAREASQDHLTFNDHMVAPKNDSPRGKETIAVLSLNRRELLDRRKEKLELLSLLHSLSNQPDTPDTERREARALLDNATQDDAEYAGMVRVAKARDFRPVSEGD